MKLTQLPPPKLFPVLFRLVFPLLSVYSLTSENPLDRMKTVFGALQKKTKAVFCRLMRPGRSFVLSFISIQHRPPWCAFPIICQSFGSATLLSLCEGHPHTQTQTEEGRILWQINRNTVSSKAHLPIFSIIISSVLRSILPFFLLRTHPSFALCAWPCLLCLYRCSFSSLSIPHMPLLY